MRQTGGIDNIYVQCQVWLYPGAGANRDMLTQYIVLQFSSLGELKSYRTTFCNIFSFASVIICCIGIYICCIGSIDYIKEKTLVFHYKRSI